LLLIAGTLAAAHGYRDEADTAFAWLDHAYQTCEGFPESTTMLPPEMKQATVSATKNTYALAALRIAVGALFLIFGQYKVFGSQFTLHGGFQFWINGFLEQGAYPFMTGILRGFVLPHATAIAFIVAYGELAIGLALILGVLVRPASFAGLIYMLALLFSSNYPTPVNYPVSSDFPGSGVVFWQYFGASLDHLVLALCFAAFLVGRADAVWSFGMSHIKKLLR
jgi:uncharacterized membrane protein YphA (DoxX/SURF4 family)